ncbi:MAG: hypothetical protein ACRC62_22855 [Microcoleus sp.]
MRITYVIYRERSGISGQPNRCHYKYMAYCCQGQLHQKNRFDGTLVQVAFEISMMASPALKQNIKYK